MVRALWNRRRADWVLISFFLPFFALISSVNVVYPRYVIPLAPVLCVLAAEFVRFLLSFVNRARPALYGLAIVALAGPGLRASIQFDRVAAVEDTRILAAGWIAENVAPQSEILLCRGYGATAINEDRRRPPAFRPESIWCSVDNVKNASARYLITHEHPRLTAFSKVPDRLRSWLEEQAEPLAVFNPFRGGEVSEGYFYLSDAFYIPFTGLETMIRGGPVIRIWRIRRI